MVAARPRRCTWALGIALSLALSLPLSLGGCAPASHEAEPFGDPFAATGAGEPVILECVPFARALSGVQLAGDAADWWWKAEGRYQRANAPVVGAVLVFRRSHRLVNGHVGVVSHVVSSREILMTQANWVRHRVIADMPVIDVSPENDWSLVRVWWPPSATMGVTRYPAHGFILPERPLSRDHLAAQMAGAVHRATSGL